MARFAQLTRRCAFLHRPAHPEATPAKGGGNPPPKQGSLPKPKRLASSTIVFTDNLATGGASSDAVLDNVRVVPEPGTAALFGVGLLGMITSRRRRSA